MRQMRQLSFYTRSQRSVASILLTVWLLASCNPNIVLAAPERERAIVPATTTIPPALTLPVDRGPGIDTALVPLSHRAASLLPRKIDRPASRFSRARLQEALSLQAGPVAEAVEESSSSGQHPAIDPSSAVVTSSIATPTLEELMSQPAVPDNKILVATLNTAPPQKQHRWLAAAVDWFDDQSIVKLPPAALQDYAALAHIQVTPANREQVRRYFDSLCNKVKDESFGEEWVIQVLAYSLAHIDPAVFEGDPKSLLDLGRKLLKN